MAGIEQRRQVGLRCVRRGGLASWRVGGWCAQARFHPLAGRQRRWTAILAARSWFSCSARSNSGWRPQGKPSTRPATLSPRTNSLLPNRKAKWVSPSPPRNP